MGVVFAAVVMAVSGVLSILQGAAAIAKNVPYANVLHYAYRFNVSAWGWIHLLFGVALVVIAVCLLGGMVWARWAGVLFAATTMALQFIFLPYYPAWALIAITLDVVILWALLMHASEPDWGPQDRR
ncbi:MULTISPECIES: hypothetical protein [Streptacidiphilus]|uniref:DUF7144 domain-containing protein n=1 Tax=Streptacidiphilus cavernicola TaxID=3342716 RepID=A0ABV6UZI5_9ACTN|nr:hypothetical protein [Streptacidiphilus jeojiense]